jgi:hypothetical protein
LAWLGEKKKESALQLCKQYLQPAIKLGEAQLDPAPKATKEVKDNQAIRLAALASLVRDPRLEAEFPDADKEAFDLFDRAFRLNPSEFRFLIGKVHSAESWRGRDWAALAREVESQPNKTDPRRAGLLALVYWKQAVVRDDPLSLLRRARRESDAAQTTKEPELLAKFQDDRKRILAALGAALIHAADSVLKQGANIKVLDEALPQFDEASRYLKEAGSLPAGAVASAKLTDGLLREAWLRGDAYRLLATDRKKAFDSYERGLRLADSKENAPHQLQLFILWFLCVSDASEAVRNDDFSPLLALFGPGSSKAQAAQEILKMADRCSAFTRAVTDDRLKRHRARAFLESGGNRLYALQIGGFKKDAHGPILKKVAFDLEQSVELDRKHREHALKYLQQEGLDPALTPEIDKIRQRIDSK